MKWKWLKIAGVIVLCPVLLVLGFIIFQKPLVILTVRGKVVAVATRCVFAPILSEGTVTVWAGKEKVFSMRQDFFDEPCFIYRFADGRRFLCDYDDDITMLDFVVDLNAPSNGVVDSPQWPADDYVRGSLRRCATNVVFNAKGVVRLPNYSELQEVAGYLTGKSAVSRKAGSFHLINWDEKNYLLLDLATNRQSFWPVD